jgi:hypothetical protein
MIPICSTLSGRLKIPVPIALARRVRMAALRAPFLMGPKALFKKGLFSEGSIESLVRTEAEGCY